MNATHTNELLSALVEAGSPSTEAQQRVMGIVETLSRNEGFGATLAHILASPAAAPVDVRQRAGLVLKTWVSRGLILADSKPVREESLRALADSHPLVRRTAGSVLTTLVANDISQPCSDVLAILLEMLTGSDINIRSGAFDALHKIVEDVIQLWRNDVRRNEGSVLVNDFLRFSGNVMIPALLTLGDTKYQIELLNQFALNFLFFPGHPLCQFMEKYVQCLGQLATASVASETLSETCKGLVFVARHHPELYKDSFGTVAQLMLSASRHSEYSIRLEALQFWPVATTTPDWLPQLQGMVSDLATVLLQNMVYTDEDYMNMDEGVLNEDDAAVPDRPEDIAPRFHKDKDDQSGADEDGEEEDNSTWGSELTVRKAAASALDHLATAFRDSILVCILPLVEARLSSTDWEVQESALLALGAIGHGCMQGLSPHLPAILNLLVSLASSKKPLLRSISCWTISRFAQWISFDTQRQTALPLALNVILGRMMDPNKRVQEAAVSAFVSLEEEVGPNLEEYAAQVVEKLTLALAYYQSKNLLILLDAIACLFEAIGGQLASHPELIRPLVVPILTAFAKLDFVREKQVAISLLECLTAICTSVGCSIDDDAILPVVVRCTDAVERSCQSFSRITHQLANEEKFDQDILSCSLDLMCGILEGRSTESSRLAARGNFMVPVCRLITQFDVESKLPLIRDFYSNAVKQCVFALLGEAARSCLDVLSVDMLKSVMPATISHVSIGAALVANNAVWALGEIFMRSNAEFVSPYTDSVLTSLLYNLNNDEFRMKPIVRQNSAITLGRLALVDAARVVSSGAFATIFTTWCDIMKKLRMDAEKLSAVQGFTMCLQIAPATVNDDLSLQAILSLIGSCVPSPRSLEDMFRLVITSYRTTLGEAAWTVAWNSLPVDTQYRLNHAYSLGMDFTKQPSPPNYVG